MLKQIRSICHVVDLDQRFFETLPIGLMVYNFTKDSSLGFNDATELKQ